MAEGGSTWPQQTLVWVLWWLAKVEFPLTFPSGVIAKFVLSSWLVGFVGVFFHNTCRNLVFWIFPVLVSWIFPTLWQTWPFG